MAVQAYSVGNKKTPHRRLLHAYLEKLRQTALLHPGVKQTEIGFPRRKPRDEEVLAGCQVVRNANCVSILRALRLYAIELPPGNKLMVLRTVVGIQLARHDTQTWV